MSDIFISYRREGGEHLAGRVKDALKARGFSVFMDVEDLKSGKFNSALFSEIERATDFLLILTPGCLDRCKNEGDWLRQEIRHAIKWERNLVPILARGFQMPPAETLPADIAELVDYNGPTPSHELFEASMDRLVSTFLISGKTEESDSPRGHATSGRMLAIIDAAVEYAGYAVSLNNLAGSLNKGDKLAEAEFEVQGRASRLSQALANCSINTMIPAKFRDADEVLTLLKSSSLVLTIGNLLRLKFSEQEDLLFVFCSCICGIVVAKEGGIATTTVVKETRRLGDLLRLPKQVVEASIEEPGVSALRRYWKGD